MIKYPCDSATITCTLMASFTMFPTVLKTYEKCYRHVRLKEVLKRHFEYRNLLQIRLISNWTLCRTTIQREIVHVISNRPYGLITFTND